MTVVLRLRVEAVKGKVTNQEFEDENLITESERWNKSRTQKAKSNVGQILSGLAPNLEVVARFIANGKRSLWT